MINFLRRSPNLENQGLMHHKGTRGELSLNNTVDTTFTVIEFYIVARMLTGFWLVTALRSSPSIPNIEYLGPRQASYRIYMDFFYTQDPRMARGEDTSNATLRDLNIVDMLGKK